MSRIIPLGSIPRTNILPSDIYRFKVTSLEETMTKERDDAKSKLMYVLKCQVVEPKSSKGTPFTTNFCIGNEDDPEAELLETWLSTFGSRNFAKFLDKVGVPFAAEENSDAVCKAVEGTEFLATIVEKTDDGTRMGGKFKGRVSNDISAFWSVGEKEPGSLPKDGTPTTTARTGRANGSAGAAKPAPSDTVKCSACPPDAPLVKRAELKGHVDGHLADMKKQAETTQQAEEAE